VFVGKLVRQTPANDKRLADAKDRSIVKGIFLSGDMQLVLTENRHLRIASFTIFYVAQGLPIGLLMIAIPAWLAGSGATATEIASYVSLAGLPWGLKLFAGPIPDAPPVISAILFDTLPLTC
jgi:hypothetical protein